MKTNFHIALAHLACATALVFAASPAAAQPGAIDPTFTPGVMDGSVGDIAIQPDQRIIVAGGFTLHNGLPATNLMRLNPDGSRDATFNASTELYSWINSVALQSDGKVLIGGAFTTVNGVGRTGFARLNSDGSLDTAFNPITASNGGVNAIRVLADGRILIGGVFKSVGGAQQLNLARLLPDGTLDTSFVGQTDDDEHSGINDLALSPDGSFYVSGSFYRISGVQRLYIARLYADGSVDESFEQRQGYVAGKLALQSDGSLMVAGGFQFPLALARLTYGGEVDPSFFSPVCDAAGDPVVYAIAVQPDGKILFGGRLGCAPFPNNINRIDPSGARDESFMPARATSNNPLGVSVIKLQQDGRILLGLYRGVVRLRNDHLTRGIEFRTDLYSVRESEPTARITVHRSGPVDKPSHVRYAVVSGTASPRTDYKHTGAKVTFRAGESDKEIEIFIRKDEEPEGIETVQLVLLDAHGSVLGDRTNATLQILDDGPYIASFSPTSGVPGDEVTISGVNFVRARYGGISSVQFNGVEAYFYVDELDVIHATVPAGAITGPITVRSPFGTDTSRETFVVLGP